MFKFLLTNNNINANSKFLFGNANILNKININLIVNNVPKAFFSEYNSRNTTRGKYNEKKNNRNYTNSDSYYSEGGNLKDFQNSQIKSK